MLTKEPPISFDSTLSLEITHFHITIIIQRTIKTDAIAIIAISHPSRPSLSGSSPPLGLSFWIVFVSNISSFSKSSLLKYKITEYDSSFCKFSFLFIIENSYVFESDVKGGFWDWIGA